MAQSVWGLRVKLETGMADVGQRIKVNNVFEIVIY